MSTPSPDFWLPLAGLAFCDALVEGGGLVAWHAERLPVLMLEVLCQQDDLAGVAGVVGELAVDCLHHPKNGS